MRHISGAPLEATQKTHRWNNHHLKEDQIKHLIGEWMVYHKGDKKARKLPSTPIVSGASAHLTKYGGWKCYLVIEPEFNLNWHIGWHWQGGAGVSRVLSRGPVRVLIGPTATRWFGIEVESNIQLPIRKIGEGVIGDGSEFSQIPLF